MASLFSAEYRYVWMIVLAAMLFFPVRQMMWVMSVRRAIRKGGEDNVNEAEKERLKKRASFTSALLCFLFSLFYTGVLLWYFLWFAAFILWVKPFTCCDFTTANKTMAVCTLYSTVLCIEMPIFFPNAIWSVYCMYLSAWYKWCLPI